VTEERVSDFGELSWEWTSGPSPSSGQDGGIVKRRRRRPSIRRRLLGVDDKRGSNRGNDKRSHCSCHGGGTSLEFVVGLLLDVDNKRGGNMGVVAVAGWQRQRRMPGICCRPALRRG
jgi:hypothetical protein